MTLYMKSLAVILFVTLLAMTLAVLLVPSLSWAGVFEFLTTSKTSGSPCGCIFGGD
jgi:hypothetical protein